MIKETTTIVDVKPDCLWVEGVQGSTCGSCVARAGCGHRLLARGQAPAPRVRVLLGTNDDAAYTIGEDVAIGIPEDVVVKGSLFIYLCPLLGLLLSAGLVEYWFARELLTTCAGIMGLVFGGLLVRLVSSLLNDRRSLQPVVLK